MNDRYKVVTIMQLFAITICLMVAFRILPYGYQLKMKDYFQFAGSLFGAVIGAVVSFEILSITIKNQREEFERQREKDEERWNTTINQFNIQVKIQGINDRINDYNLAINSLLELQSAIENYCGIIDKSKFMYDKEQKKDDLNKYNVSILKSHIHILKLMNNAELISKCFNSKSIKDDYTLIGKKISIDDIYTSQIENLSYNTNEYRKICEEYISYLIKISSIILKLNRKIGEDIENLYQEKYNLTEQCK